MKSNINITPIRTWSSIPSSWESRPNTINYNLLPEADLYSDGWRDVIVSSYDSNTQKLGALEYDTINDVVTYQVIDLTEAEIQSRVQSQAESERQVKMQIKTEREMDIKFQAITDNNEALANKEIYPIWHTLEDGFVFTLEYKVQGFEGTELKLFRCIQVHDKQSDRNPINVPALWTKIEYSQGIEVWSQPTGGDGKYPYLDPLTGNQYLVTHNGKTWQNINQGGLNVWEPSVFGWEEIV